MRRAAIIIAAAVIAVWASVAGAATPVEGRQRVGLVLSGGGSKGIAHIGVIQALEDHDVAVDYVTGTSMGAIIGSLYAMGYSPAEMLELIESKGFGYWSQGKIDQAYTYLLLEREATPAMFHLNVGGKTGSTEGAELAGVLPTSLINPIPMSFAFMELFGASTAQCGGDFDRLFVPFRCVCSDVYHKHKVVCGSGSLGEAVRASMSFPLVFQPIEIDSTLMYDGGIYDNFPFDVMREVFDPSIMIGVDVSSPDKKPSPTNLMSQLESMIIQKNDYDLPADEGIRIKIDLEEFSLLDFGKAAEIYAIGYRHGEEMIDSIMKRVTARTPASELAARRKAWREATPGLTFDSVEVKGCTPAQARFLTRIFAPRERADTFGISHARDAFYRAVSPGRFSSLVPHAVYDSVSGLFRIRLDATIKRNIDLAAGGYITSSANSFLYLSGAYNNLTTHFTTAEASAWIGQSYAAAMAGVDHGLSTRIPMTIGVRTAITRQKFYEDETFFYQLKAPTFITNSQFYAMLDWAMGVSRRSVVELGAGYGHLWDSFYERADMDRDNAGRDRTRYNLGQVYAEWRHSTLDNVNYPVKGLWASARLSGITGNVHYEPFDDMRPHERRRLSWASLRAGVKWYEPLCEEFSLGLTFDGVASTRPLLDNYNATMVSAPAFTPTPSSFNAYNPAFRANSWAAAGVSPVWHPSGVFQVRGTFDCFMAARRILEDPLTLRPRYGGWFDSPRFFGEIDAMLTTPYATLGAFCNYTSYPAHNWSVGISLGLFHLAPGFL